ncbi:hypothetical protein DPMN_121303 [Dreissena polymorpha]|uniref:Uncharacterized protein n=1 Tax=Dreissena polymorpha TaxID=45954 RepID=A0A9D4GLU6_DREPO|nr:hypothetical protein DPMN_121303 [Dreissena polymorpha]
MTYHVGVMTWSSVELIKCQSHRAVYMNTKHTTRGNNSPAAACTVVFLVPSTKVTANIIKGTTATKNKSTA